MSLDDTTQFIKGNTMQLKDLFKPNEFGHVPVITTYSDSILEPLGDNKYSYKHNKYVIYDGDLELTESPDEVRAQYSVSSEGVTTYLIVNYIVPCTSDMILLATTLGVNHA